MFSGGSKENIGKKSVKIEAYLGPYQTSKDVQQMSATLFVLLDNPEFWFAFFNKKVFVWEYSILHTYFLLEIITTQFYYICLPLCSLEMKTLNHKKY